MGGIGGRFITGIEGHRDAGSVEGVNVLGSNFGGAKNGTIHEVVQREAALTNDRARGVASEGAFNVVIDNGPRLGKVAHSQVVMSSTPVRGERGRAPEVVSQIYLQTQGKVRRARNYNS